MQALILAGGQGTRLRPLTLSTPKPITTIANRPFLNYQLDLLQRAGVNEVILSLSYQPEKIMAVFGDGRARGLKIHYPVEPEPLGTAGAFKYSESQIQGTTIVFNGDILTDIDLAAVVAQHRQRRAVATLVLVPVENPQAYGLVTTAPDGQILQFLEKPQRHEITCNTINAGMYVLEPEVLQYIPANENHSFEYGLFPRLLSEQLPVYAVISNNYWLDIGTNSRYLQANLDVLQGKLNLASAVDTPTLATAAPTLIAANHLIAANSRVSTSALITNSVVGENCDLGDAVQLENSVVLNNVKIAPNSIVRNTIVGQHAQLGRNVVVENSVLGDHSVITDFSRVGTW
jgi:mannose-1-phosphate guanylyltransferase